MPGGEPPVGRITRRPDYLAAAKGRRFHTERLTAQGRLRDDGPPGGLRVGFTVTKREGHATERNRIRRRLKVAAQIAATQAGPAQRDKPADVVLIGRRDGPRGVLRPAGRGRPAGPRRGDEAESAAGSLEGHRSPRTRRGGGRGGTRGPGGTEAAPQGAPPKRNS